MKSNRDYFNDAENFVNDNYSNATGSMDYLSMDGFENADGMQKAPNAQVSQPYIINIANSTASAVTAVIFNSYTNRILGTAGNFGNAAAITITSAITTVTYAQLLAQTENKPFTVGMIYLNGTAGSTAAQITQPITLTMSDANGNSNNKIMVPQVDPYQNITTVLKLDYVHTLDGFTQYSVSILANSTLQLSIFPSQTVDPTRNLSTGQVMKTYTNPGIVAPLFRGQLGS